MISTEESKNLGTCLECQDTYCKNCSDANDQENYCSAFCEEESINA